MPLPGAVCMLSSVPQASLLGFPQGAGPGADCPSCHSRMLILPMNLGELALVLTMLLIYSGVQVLPMTLRWKRDKFHMCPASLHQLV